MCVGYFIFLLCSQEVDSDKDSCSITINTKIFVVCLSVSVSYIETRTEARVGNQRKFTCGIGMRASNAAVM